MGFQAVTLWVNVASIRSEAPPLSVTRPAPICSSTSALLALPRATALASVMTAPAVGLVHVLGSHQALPVRAFVAYSAPTIRSTITRKMASPLMYYLPQESGTTACGRRVLVRTHVLLSPCVRSQRLSGYRGHPPGATTTSFRISSSRVTSSTSLSPRPERLTMMNWSGLMVEARRRAYA